MLVAGGIVWGMRRLFSKAGQQRTRVGIAGDLILCAAWCSAIGLALCGRQGWQWWPEETWKQIWWPITVGSLVLAVLHRTGKVDGGLRVVLVAIAAVSTAYIAMPGGDGWTDVIPIHRDWMWLIAVSCVANTWSLRRMVDDGAGRWVGWVAIAGLGGALAYSAGSFGGISEWIAAGITAAIVATVLSSLKSIDSGSAILYPTMLFVASSTASARFYAWDEQIPWVLGLILLGPTIVGIVDWPIRQKSAWIRIVASAVVASAVLIAIVAKLYVPAEL
jgi:hypothetical protein